MPYHPAIRFRDERHREGLGGAERLDDVLLRVIADLQGLERGDGHRGDRARIGPGFVPDHDLRAHRFSLIPLANGTHQPRASTRRPGCPC